MHAVVTGRIGRFVGLFGAALCAHMLLPGTLPFALVLACLCIGALLWATGGPGRDELPETVVGVEEGVALDDELAMLEAELHAQRDQHLTRLRTDVHAA